ncbi:unnamed protein product, partial [Rotaria sp. Silwood2]
CYDLLFIVTIEGDIACTSEVVVWHRAMTNSDNQLTVKSIFFLIGESGSFILFTSCLGFSTSLDGTAPMCLHGYRVFYRIGSDAITFFVSAYVNCSDTNTQALADSIERTLIEVKTSFMKSNLF